MDKEEFTERELDLIELMANINLIDHSYYSPAYEAATVDINELIALREKVRKM